MAFVALRRGSVWWGFVAGHVLAFGGTTAAQQTVPLERTPEQPLPPPAISTADVRISGRLAYLWEQPDGTEVIQVVGEFSLEHGPRRMSAGEAVVWMQRGEREGVSYLALTVFLHRDARVVEPAGTVTTGPSLLVTLNTTGRVELFVDARSFESSSETSLYRLAEEQRALLAEQREREVTRPEEPPAPPKEKARRRLVFIRPGRSMISEVRGAERLIILRGGVYLAQQSETGEELVEIRADHAVLYAPLGALEAIEQPGKEREVTPEEWEAQARRQAQAGGLFGEVAGGLAAPLSGAYLEGDVLLSRGGQSVRASRLYYDFDTNRALIFDAVLRTPVPERNVPIYVRAERVRQISAREYVAQDARISTSEFYTPHYSLGAVSVYLMDRTVRRGEITGPVAGTFEARHATLQVEGTPVAYWPYVRGDFRQTETLLRRFNLSYSDDFGFTVETGWYLSNLLGLPPVEGFDSTLKLDYFEERGPAAGVDIDYQRDTYFGLFRSYYVRDHGEDDLGGLRNGFEAPDDRGRVLWRHRHYLPQDWELTLELSYISDENFLEEYFEKEFDTGKAQETLIYLKKQVDNWAFTLLAQWRILDWLTQTEHLPEAAFHWIGQPLFGTPATLFTSTRVGAVRFRRDERLDFRRLPFDNTRDTDITFRADSRNEVTLPFSVGPVNVVPFVVARGSWWDGTPTRGSEGRYFGSYGVRSSLYLSRAWPEFASRLWDFDGLRHIIKFDVTAWGSHSNVGSAQLTPFDFGVETIDDFGGVALGVRQRFQTRRGPPDARRVVDWLTIDLEAGLFGGETSKAFSHGTAFTYRPEISIPENHVAGNLIWRISDTTAFLSEFNIDLDRGAAATVNASLAVERTPRLAYFVGYRFIGETDSNLFGFGGNYRISRKHTVAVRNYYDLERGENAEFAITYIRRFPRWFVATTFELNDAEDNVGVSLSAWPEGAPELAVGARRYTGLPTTTAISP